LQHVSREDPSQSAGGRGAQLERAIEDGRLRGREQELAQAVVALAPLAAQDREADGRVVAGRAEALLAEAGLLRLSM